MSLREEQWIRAFKSRAVRETFCVMRRFELVLPLNISGTKISSTLKFVGHVARDGKK